MMRQSSLRTKKYPANRGLQRALAVAVFALALVVLAQLVPWGGAGQSPRATPLPPVTPTPAAPSIEAAATPDPNEAPRPGFDDGMQGESGTASVVIPAQEWQAIQLGAYSTAEAAAAQAGQYTARGAAGYTLQDDKFRVLAAVYASREDAETIKARLKEVQGIDTYIYQLGTDAVELNVTAAANQIQALREGFDVLQQALLEMGRLSAELDKQRLDGAGVVLAAQRMRLEVQDRARALEAALGTDGGEVVIGLRALLLTADRGLEIICAQNAQETVAMSAKIKYNQIDLLWQWVQYLRQISGQII